MIASVLSLICLFHPLNAEIANPYPRMTNYSLQFAARGVAIWKSGSFGTYAIRDLTAAAWRLLNPAWTIDNTPPSQENISTAIGMLDTVFSRQLPSGQWPWQFDQDNVTDNNAVQFVSMPLLRCFISAQHLLPADWIKGKMAKLELAAQVHRQNSNKSQHTLVCEYLGA